MSLVSLGAQGARAWTVSRAQAVDSFETAPVRTSACAHSCARIQAPRSSGPRAKRPSPDRRPRPSHAKQTANEPEARPERTGGRRKFGGRATENAGHQTEVRTRQAYLEPPEARQPPGAAGGGISKQTAGEPRTSATERQIAKDVPSVPRTARAPAATRRRGGRHLETNGQ